MKKSLQSLVPEDLRLHLIWHPIDDLEDSGMEVMPYEGEVINLEDIYLVAAKFILADGSEWEGYIRFSWGTVREMALAINNLEFYSFALERNVEIEEGHRRFAQVLNRDYSEVFPIAYQTKVKLILHNTVH